MAQQPMVPLAGSGTPVKLTNWKKEPTILALKQDLLAAKPAHDTQVNRINNWNDLLQVRGKHRPAVVKGRSSVQPKLIRRQAEWRYSALTEPFLGTNKLFKVSPVTFEDGDAARQSELVLNWQFRTKLNRVKFIDDYVRSTVDEGTCIVRTGWKRRTIMVTQTVPVFAHYAIESQKDGQAFQQALAAKQDNIRGFEEGAPPEMKAAVDFYEENGQATVAKQTGTQEVQVEQILENYPTVEVQNPANVFIDPSCQGDLDKALFTIISFETNKAELLKEGKRYKNLELVNWEGNSPITNPDHETTTPNDFRFNDLARRKAVAYEYWGFLDIDGNGSLTAIVCTWIGDVLIRMEKNPYPDQKIPLVLVPYLPVKRDLYGEPDAELLEDNQKILGAITRGMIDLLGRSANGQQGFAKGMLDVLNRRRFDNGQDYEFNPSLQPSMGHIEHKYPELPQSALLMLNLQNQEAESLTGVKAFAGGVSGEAYGDVAAGIRGALDASSKREMAILRRLAKGMTQVGQKITTMNQAFMSDKEVIRITNEEFVSIKREDIQGNFDLETDISTAEVDDAKAKDLAFMLQTLGPGSDPGMSMMILAEIASLKRMPELAHKISTYKPQPDPMAEQMKQLEMQKLQMEVEALKAKAQLDLANAGRAGSQKDKADLDYVEQESGTNHARAMDLQRAQSEGNQALEVTKALTTPRKLANGAQSKPDVDAALGFNMLSGRLSSSGTQGPTFQMPTFNS